MQRTSQSLLPTTVVLAGIVLALSGPDGPLDMRPAAAAEHAGGVASDLEGAAATVAEARQRARILHETLHGALQVMHRDFFREDEGLMIPSRSLEDVFRELADRFEVELRWLAVSADAMNTDHMPQTNFERDAVKAIAAGKQEFDASEGEVYRYAGEIRLSSQCLRCHAPRRTSAKDRSAGLVISIPLSTRQVE